MSEAISRAIIRLKKLHNYAGRPAWDEIVRQELQIEADENKKLRSLLAEYRDKTPLGHQPHMIAHRADEALGRPCFKTEDETK